MYISPLRFLILEEYVLQQSSNTGLSKLDLLCHTPDLTSPRTDHWVWRGWKLDNHHRVALLDKTTIANQASYIQLLTHQAHTQKSSWEIYYPVWSLTLITEYGSIQKYFGVPTSWEDQVYAQIVHTKCSFIFQDAGYKASKHIDKISLWNCQARAREKWLHPTWESLNTVWITSVARWCSLLRGGENSLSSVYCTWLLYKSTTRFKLSTGCSAHLELGFITILSTTCITKGIILL